MATTIRLTRMGRKKRPFYRLVVLDSRKRRDGAYLANLGYYNPFCDPHEVKLHGEEVLEWLGKGATVSETARSLLRAEGLLYKFSLVKAGTDPAEIETRMTEWHAKAESKMARQVEARAAKIESAKKAKEDAEAEAKAEAEALAKAEADEKAEAAAKEKAEAETAEAAAVEEPAEEPAEEAPADASEDEDGKK